MTRCLRRSWLGYFSLVTDPNGSQVTDSWPIQNAPIYVEPRTVARAVPALLHRIPCDQASEVRAYSRVRMQRARGIAVGGHLFRARADDGTFTHRNAF